ncbi:hypothetical protein RchiOBHm_Chr6g0247131 [Rosa chinensis]|uniref:Uncharacterized protein n=1 Tax=Rosa chinensis TaxID=74649 RepID=A0A2P6PJQ6_ROSCH|nr:uncharacterized protein LOC112169980 [Rosa chinensis]XP_024162879.1 uncharacterized protein LOC112169980 [Rosa chinensis]XP_024162880.1 uncharacterized protein LOC112169980 [Rosa chinensis]XP_024162881.1 uncharacterized protein LOC112169980 [Rosa chinensis]XP_024162882.1 uncharacterized protein LOC112169980 [Rosa chinensis]PRQ22154.1 hypothetical protein RchiOBHm_Chr6g0247131 [Rosa chinensis]
MDLETENRIAAILMREAAELRRQAEKEGVHAYLQQPKARFRPNSRFLSATVRGVEQANKAVEVNEMWRIRQKELELDERLKGKMKDESRNDRNPGDGNTPRSTSKRHASMEDNVSATCSSSQGVYERCHSREENGLRDEELEEFLHSRVKRGRGAVGSRMDETGPYLPRSDSEEQIAGPSLQERRVYGPEKPSQKLCDSSEEELPNRKRSKKVSSGSSKKHRSKDKSKERKKKKRKEEKRSKYYD